MIYLCRSKKKEAFTLIEILVSISILVFILLSFSSILKNISTNQKELSADSLTLDNIDYFLRIASDNLRQAQKSDGTLCGIAENKFFNIGDTYIDFIKDEECYSFELFNDGGVNRIIMYAGSKGGGYISSSNINIISLFFEIEDYIEYGQPIVTILIKAMPVNNLSNYISDQTSVSVSYYD